MSDVYVMGWPEVAERLGRCPQLLAWGVPRGGAVLAGLLLARRQVIADSPEAAEVIVDDVVETGRTRDAWAGRQPGKLFWGLVDKTDPAEPLRGRWVRFPWEPEGEELADAEACVGRLLALLGEDPRRDGLADTPRRVAAALREMTSGRDFDPGTVLRVQFEEACDEMVLVRDVPFSSTCEHHLLPFSGTAAVGYLPAGGRIVGLSKIARLVHGLSLRLQVQERLARQVGEAIVEHLRPLGAGVVLTAHHSCMSARGARSTGSMVTSYLSGRFRDDQAVRAEFLGFAGP